MLCRDLFRTLSNIRDGKFSEIVDSLQPLTIFPKRSILDVWQDLNTPLLWKISAAYCLFQDTNNLVPRVISPSSSSKRCAGNEVEIQRLALILFFHLNYSMLQFLKQFNVSFGHFKFKMNDFYVTRCNEKKINKNSLVSRMNEDLILGEKADTLIK